MEDVSPKHSRLNFSKKLLGRLLFQTVKLPYYFQEAKCKMKKPSLSICILSCIKFLVFKIFKFQQKENKLPPRK